LGIFGLVLLFAVGGQAASCQCGREKVQTRIVGGTPAKAQRYPWMVGLAKPAWYFCGGSLINDRYVLTAAHCAVGSRVEETKITFNSHSFEDLIRNKNHAIEKIIVHPGYDDNDNDVRHDIALFKLAKPVTFTDSLHPICLGTQTKFANLFVTGWGLTTAQSNIMGEQLNEASLSIVSDADCKKQWGTNGTLQLCAGGKDRSACDGDSGGPLSTREGGRVHQVGLVSFGHDDCGVSSGASLVYTRIAGYLDWIKANTKDAVYCD